MHVIPATCWPGLPVRAGQRQRVCWCGHRCICPGCCMPQPAIKHTMDIESMQPLRIFSRCRRGICSRSGSTEPACSAHAGPAKQGTAAAQQPCRFLRQQNGCPPHRRGVAHPEVSRRRQTAPAAARAASEDISTASSRHPICRQPARRSCGEVSAAHRMLLHPWYRHWLP